MIRRLYVGNFNVNPRVNLEVVVHVVLKLLTGAHLITEKESSILPQSNITNKNKYL